MSTPYSPEDVRDRENRREHVRMILLGVAVVLVIAMVITAIALAVHVFRVPPQVFTDRQAACTTAGGLYVHLDGQSQWTCLTNGDH